MMQWAEAAHDLRYVVVRRDDCRARPGRTPSPCWHVYSLRRYARLNCTRCSFDAPHTPAKKEKRRGRTVHPRQHGFFRERSKYASGNKKKLFDN